MTTLLEASRMALEALECYPVTVNHWKIKLLPAATALRTAISEAEKVEPMAWQRIDPETKERIWDEDSFSSHPNDLDDCVPLYLAPQPAPKQEPVATATRSSKHGGIEWSGSEALADALGRFGSDRLVHLYLAPVPAQEPITPQALIEAANSLPGLVSGTSNWASAMAAKLNAAVVKDSLTTQERKPKWNVLAITTAYEQGFGKGIQAKHRGSEISNPYAEGDCREAWAYGYAEGIDKPKAEPEPTPLEAKLVDTLLWQMEAKEQQ